MRFIFLLFVLFFFVSCQDEILIKPKAQLSLSYPLANYEELHLDFPYNFQKNKDAVLKEKKNNGLNLYYPAMKAPYLFYCQSGNRSGMATSILQQSGVDQVFNGGGLADMRIALM